MSQPTRNGPTVSDLLGALAKDTGTLVRQEVRLASAEMSHKAKSAAGTAAVIALGGALAHAGVLAFLAGIILALEPFEPMWLSALVVGAVVIGIGYALIQRGVHALREIDPVPRETAKTLQQDRLWLKEQFR